MSENLPPNETNQPAESEMVPGAGPLPYYTGEAPAAPATVVPGRTLGIVGLVLAILLPIIGLVLSIIAFVKSKKAGFRNIPGVVGMILGALGTIAWIFGIIALVGLIWAGVNVMEVCDADMTASVEIAGQVVPCAALEDDAVQIY